MSTLAAALTHPDVERIARSLRARPGRELTLDETWRRAAVSLVVRVDDARALELLLIQRAAFHGDPWSGHVALPGGRQEPGDASLEATAFRETLEETGLDLASSGRLLGRLDDLEPRTIALPRLVIAPFVVVVGERPRLALSDEVADAFWVPVSSLQDPAATREVVLELQGGARAVSSFHHSGRIIWGLTERILRDFLERLAE